MFLSGGVPFPVQTEALGETTPLYVGGNYYSQSPLLLNERFALYTELYRRQLWVYVVCRKVAVSTARLGMNVWLPGETGKTNASDSPYGQLLARPNPRMSGKQLMLWTASTYEIHGEAIWVKLRDASGQVRELHPMHPMNTVVRRADDDTIWYIFTSGAKDHRGVLPPIPEQDVLHFKAYNPDNLLRGMSQLEPLRATLANEDSIRRANDSFWKRGARPSVALVHPKTLSKAAADRLRASWESRHAGADNVGGTAILEEGMEPKILQLSSEEMQYIDSRKLNREEVCAAADIPPPVVHILDNATYSNITEQMRSMYRDTMAPRLGVYEAELDRALAPEFDDALQARFNLDDVLRGDFETRATAAVSLVVNGIMQPAEARPIFDLPRMDDGVADRLYANQAMQPLGTPVRHTNITEDLSVDAAPTVRSVTKAVSPEARQRLVDEHTRKLGQLFAKQRDQAVKAAATKAATAPQATAQAVVEPDAWQDQLAQQLVVLGAATAQAYGSDEAKQLGGDFDPEPVQEQVAQDAQDSAAAINGATVAEVAALLLRGAAVADAVLQVFGRLVPGEDGSGGDRLRQIAQTRVKRVAGMAGQAGARQAGASLKRWRTGRNPRPEHAAMDGETVRVGQKFSNGLEYPGDGPPEESARCNCSLSYVRERPDG